MRGRILTMKKITIALIAINLLQLFIGLLLRKNAGFIGLEALSPTLYPVAALMLLCNAVTIAGLSIAVKYRNRDLEESLHNLEQLNATLRSQRHDYLNHFQVIYGLLELQEYEEAKKYLTPVFKDIMKVSRALKTSEPAVNALLQVKMGAAEQAGIDFYPEIKSELKALPIEAWNLCKILSNLIDNSMEALAEAVQEEKKIELDISEDEKSYCFLVRNNGPMIPFDMQKEIFRMGVSGKKEEGHGMGLFIVSEIVKEASGTMSLSSEPDNTCFTVILPKKKE